MKKLIQSLRSFLDQDGSVVIFIALALIMLLGFGALAFDIGYITVTKNELQNISDGASLGATRKLGAIYEPMSYQEQQNYNATNNADDIIAIAKDVGIKNQAGKKNITISDADVIIGTWDGQTKTLTPTLNQPDAVRVISRRSEGSANGPISNFFAKVLGKDTTNVNADAVAALTGLKEAKPGEPDIPVGVSKYWFDTNSCGNKITFAPTPTSCAGWNNYDQWPASDSKIRKTLEDMLKGTYTPPGAEAYETEFIFIGGKLSKQTFDALEALFNDRKTKDGDGKDDVWTTMVAVYDLNCENPTGRIKIVGFAIFEMEIVSGPSEKELRGTLMCKLFKPSRGGGGEYGVKGTIPNLVE